MKSEDRLKRETEKYWKFKEGIVAKLEKYIKEKKTTLENKSLLEAELEYVRSQGRIKVQPCNTLVLLVGHSLEPLLQTICVYHPKRIILLLNEAGYGEEEWHVFAEHLVEAIRLLSPGLLTRQPKISGEEGKQGFPVKDSPESVFQKLVEVLHDEHDVVIDITGGKKSMVSGAYLYAAYAGTRISYVDFDEYDPEYRRPYGYTCKIGEISNPYKAFALREWERVRELYRRYQFRAARRVLENQVLPAVKKWQPDAESSAMNIMEILQFYELWDSGDYKGAKSLADKNVWPNKLKPDVVTKLGEYWFEIRGTQLTSFPKDFYGNQDWIKVYACDELARIERLIHYHEDYRSAFLRAGGLNEVIMVARVVALIPPGEDKKRFTTALEQETPRVKRVFHALTDPNKTIIGVGKGKDISFRNAPNLQINRPSPMQAWWNATQIFRDTSSEKGWKKFLHFRNKLAHTYFSVSRQWAEEALKFVRLNIENFWGASVCENIRNQALPWTSLCELTGVDRFLPPNLREEV